MKRLLLIATALTIGISATSPAQNANWRRVNASHTGNYQGVSFPTADMGYAVSTPGNFVDPESYLLRTTDGGSTWTSKTLPNISVSDVHFSTVQKGIIIGRDLETSVGLVTTTTNGGQNWTPRTFPDFSSFASILFASPTTALISGPKGRIMRSTDAGENWTTVTVLPGSEVSLGVMSFPSATVGYVLGSLLEGGALRNMVFKTTNGGLAWTKILDAGTGQNKPDYQSLTFVTPEVGYITGRQNGRAVFKTTDGGEHWTRIFDPQDGDLTTMLAGVSFMTEQLGYVCGSDGSIMKTTDGGQNWTPENSSTSNALSAFYFHDAENGVVAGLFGTLLKRNPPKPTAITDEAALDFGNIANEPKEMTVTISAGNSLGLRIESAAIVEPASGFSITSSLGTLPRTLAFNEPLQITVRYQADPTVEKLMESQLRIVTNDAAAPEMNIPLTANQQKAAQPGATLSTTALNFGPVPSNQKKTLTVSVQAANEAGLSISGIAINPASGSAFKVLEPAGSFPITVQSGTPLVVRVEFDPATEGQSYTGTLVITTNDAATPAREVSLAGTGSASVASVDNTGAIAGRLQIECAPNPVTDQARMTVNLPNGCERMSVTLINVLGQLVATLHDGPAAAGQHAFPVDASKLAKGFYYFTVHADGRMGMQEMVVTR